ncbi:N,N-dimethylformamidase beta subunit family domain-containing protein [Streptomyces sp. NPDC086023]|uniref:N,N-dimethylformamidase beta subunit family domain-containing protein n=1 Tax=Streptomyces sp. NPDC086023 TaxID=3365746 RepID=UPI0037CCE28C
MLGIAAAALAAPPGWLGTPTATAAPARRQPPPACPLDVCAENARPGAMDWRITRAGPASSVEGFADRVSVRAGETLGLHVSTTSAAYTVSAYRMGWYGGARARLVWRSGPIRGERQPGPVRDPATRMVRTAWRRTVELDTSGWPEGCYLLRLATTDGKGRRFVPVTVRGASAAGRMVVVNSVATWQAYNPWGGADLYKGPDLRNRTRSLAVSFDRPYRSGSGSGQFLRYEAPLIALAERLGLPLAYATGVDVAREPGLLDGALAVLSLGHDEYWSPAQRLHVTRARDAGTNLAVFGANCCYRRVRYDCSPVGPDRVVVCYKDDYAADPGFRRGEPPTNDFRSRPLPEPESSLLGVLYDGFPVDAPYVVSEAGHWLLAGTGVRPGDSFAHLVGVEFDRVPTSRATLRPVEVLAHSPVVCKGRPSYADTAYATLPGGAGVFATGTMRWVEALDAQGPGGGKSNHGLGADAGRFTRIVTENVLRAFAAGPAGRARPARDNLTAHYADARPHRDGAPPPRAEPPCPPAPAAASPSPAAHYGEARAAAGGPPGV